jgi:hypothetical protein
MNSPSSPSGSKLEKSARKLREANQSGKNASHRQSADAQNELDNPEQAKGRPKTGDQSNAGRDGGA